jgi:hypothetical protein
MGLRQALDHLPSDRATEATIRELLQFMRDHVDEPMSAASVSDAIGRPSGEVIVILLQLAEDSVLRREGAGFAYPRDLLVDVEVERFTRRVDVHSRYVRQNVAKVRDRFGQR